VKEGGADKEPERKKKGADTRMRERIQCFGIFLFFPSSTGCFLSPAPPGGLQKRVKTDLLHVSWCKLRTLSVFVQCSLCRLTQPFFRASASSSNYKHHIDHIQPLKPPFEAITMTHTFLISSRALENTERTRRQGTKM